MLVEGFAIRRRCVVTMILDFPKQMEEKLEKVEMLIEKQYVDQAICEIDRYLKQPQLCMFYGVLYKKLLTCLLMKREFEDAQDVFLKLESEEDQFVMAHEVLLAKWSGEDKLSEYMKKLKPHSIRYQALTELVNHFEIFYVSHWEREDEQKMNRLLKSASLDVALGIVADLEQWDASQLLAKEEAVRLVFVSPLHPLVKTGLAEILVKKQLAWTITYQEGERMRTLTLESSVFETLERVIESGRALIFEQASEVAEEVFQLYRLFCASSFPFLETFDKDEVVLAFLMCFGVASLEKNDIIVSELKKKAILSQTFSEVEGFILSLTK